MAIDRNQSSELIRSWLTEEEQRTVADRRTREKDTKTKDALLTRLKKGMQTGLVAATDSLVTDANPTTGQRPIGKAERATHLPETKPASRGSSVMSCDPITRLQKGSGS